MNAVTMPAGYRRALLLAFTVLASASAAEGASVALFESPVSASAIAPRTTILAIAPGTIVADNGSSATVPVTSATSGVIAQISPSSMTLVTLEIREDSTYPKGNWELAIGAARLAGERDSAIASGVASITTVTDITFTGRGMKPGSQINAALVIAESNGITVRMTFTIVAS